MLAQDPGPLLQRSKASPTDPERFAGTREPLLCELLDDPLTHRVMARDGLRRDHVIALMEEAKAKLAAGGVRQ